MMALFAGCARARALAQGAGAVPHVTLVDVEPVGFRRVQVLLCHPLTL